MKKQCCQRGCCVKTMNIQYHMITAAAHIESLGEMRWVHGLNKLCLYTASQAVQDNSALGRVVTWGELSKHQVDLPLV